MFNVVVLQNVVSSFEKGSNGQNHSLSDSNHSIKNFPLAEFPIPLPLNAIRKTFWQELLVGYEIDDNRLSLEERVEWLVCHYDTKSLH